ncbi:hypothetical protein JHK87_016043 [Glycine soja]|nr:hypothetical protein JHK87_016043 [Glycine soja]
MSFFAYFHHGGVFRKNGQDVVYDNGTKDAKEVTNLDNWSYFKVVGIVKEDLKCDMGVRLWWINDGPKYVARYRAIKCNVDAVELGKYCVEHQCPVDIYVEHVVGDVSWFEDGLPRIVEDEIGSQTTRGGRSDKGTVQFRVIENDGPVGSDSDDSDEANDVYLDESEEERALVLDDDVVPVYWYGQGKKVNVSATIVKLTLKEIIKKLSNDSPCY